MYIVFGCGVNFPVKLTRVEIQLKQLERLVNTQQYRNATSVIVKQAVHFLNAIYMNYPMLLKDNISQNYHR